MSVSIEWLILCVCVHICICVFQCQEQGQLQECVSAVRACLARLDYVIQVHTTTQPPFSSPPYPSLCLIFSPFHLLYLSFSSPHDSLSCLSSLSLITFSLLHILFLYSYFLPLWPSTSYTSLPLVPSIVLLFSALPFLCQVGVRSLLSQLANYNMLP